jgi:hypothetical protein
MAPAPSETRPTEAESYLKPILSLLFALLMVGGIGTRIVLRPSRIDPPRPVEIVQEIPEPVSLPAFEPQPTPEPPASKPAPKLDLAAVARAEKGLDTATKDRALAESRLADVELSLERTQQIADRDKSLALSLEDRVADPKVRIDRAIAEGGRTAAERDRLKAEVGKLASTAKPRPKAILDKSPVSRPIKGNEVHFEVRQGRVAPIEIDRLIELVKTDAQIRLKVGSVRGRPINSTVGPIGAFSMRYELGLMMDDSSLNRFDLSSVNIGLRGWEIVPESPERGETLEQVVRPGSEYANAVYRLVPGKTSVTFWVYPDGFPLYRRLRDDLHARGYLVAARPLPDGLPIQASPSGSASAAQ